MTNLENVLKSKDITFANKGPSSWSYGFSSSHIWMWELNHREGWLPKNWCFRIVVLEKTLGSPLDSKKIKLVNSKGDQPWIFIGRADAETEAPIHWPPDAKSWLIGKDPDAGRLKTRGEGDNRGWDGWMALLTQGHEFEQTQGDSEGQRNLAHRSPQRHRELDMTWRLKNNNEEKDRPGGQWTSKEKVE